IGGAWYEYKEKQNFSSQLDFPKELKEITGAFVALEGKGDKKSIYLTAGHGAERLYRYSFTSQAVEITKEIKGKPYHLVPFTEASKDEGFKAIHRVIERVEKGKGSAVLWKSQEGHLLLELNHGVMSFEKKEGLYHALEFPGYYLAYPDSEVLFGFTDYLHLVHKETHKEKIVVMAPGDLAGNADLFAVASDIIKNLENPQFFQARALVEKPQVYDLNEKGAPIPKTSRESLYLAKVALVARAYEKTGHYLELAEAMGALDEEGETFLKQMVQEEDKHPDALNCRLRALCLLKKNAILFDSREIDPKKKEAKALELLKKCDETLYSRYLETCGLGALEPIRVSSEKLLWTWIVSKAGKHSVYGKFPQLKRRYQELYEGVAPEAIVTQEARPYGIEDVAFHRETIMDISAATLMPWQHRPLEEKAAFIRDKELVPTIGGDRNFIAHFFEFYKEAKSGAASQALKSRLAIMRSERDEKSRYLAWMLECVIRHPRRFPPVEELDRDLTNGVTYKDYLGHLKAKTPLEIVCDFMNKIRAGLPYFSSRDIGKTMLASKICFEEVEESGVLDKHLETKLKITQVVARVLLTVGHLLVKVGIRVWRFIGWLDACPKVRKLIKDLSKEKKGLASTRQYHHGSQKQQLLPLSLEKKVFMEQPPEQISPALKKELEEKYALSRKRRDKLKQEVLALAEKLPQDSKGATLVRAKRLSQEEAALTIEELQWLFILGEEKSYLENTYLRVDEVAHLDHLVGEYLQETILENQAKECVALYAEWQNTSGAHDKDHLEKRLQEVMQAKPQYNAQEHREYLVFEAVSGMRLRKNQVDKLQKLSIEERASKVFHMLMGEGKSKVMAPLWVLMMLLRRKSSENKKPLPLLIVPQALYPTGKEDSKMTLYRSFGRFAHPFEFERTSDFSKEKLHTTREALKQYKEERGFIYTTRESLLSFYLKTRELFYQYEEAEGVQAKAELESSIELAWDILKDFKESGVTLFDEVDTLLNCRDELNYTFGQSSTINPMEIESVYDMLRFLITEPKLQKLLDIKHNNQAKVSTATYEKEIKPLLVQKVAKKYGVPEAYFYDTVDKVPEAVVKHSQRDAIAVAKVLITTFLPHTLARKGNEHYGLGSRADFCIPYVANNTPNEKAEFASYLETLLYTGYHYLQQALTEKQLKAFRQACIVKAKNEQIVEKTQMKETRAYVLFHQVTGLDLLNPELDYEKAKEYMHKHPKELLTYCQEHVAPTVKVFTKKLGANPHHLAAFVPKGDAMT
ncbi:MAG: DUF3638 domain-containing protein, partial [Chlamydiae bacterium]|nr:DUF3638 domain-containing protein [Chlamydiota bacterium]